MPTPAELQQLRTSLTPSPEAKKRSLRLWIVLAVIAVLLICLASFLAILTPPKVTVQSTQFMTKNMDASETKLGSVKFTGQNPEVPEQLPLAQATPSQLATAEVVTALIKRYDLNRVSPDSEYWSNDRYSFGKDKYEDVYTLVTSQYEQAEKLPIVQKEAAVQAAQTFLAQIAPNMNLVPLTTEIKYVDFGQEAAEVEPEKATGILIPFAPKIEALSVFYRNQTAYPFLVTVDGKGAIRRVVFLPQFQTYTQVSQAKTISVEEAMKQITEGNASIIDATYTSEPVKLSDLKKAELTSANLEYREDSSQQLVIPFYRFTGKATTENNITVDVQIITPAVKVTPAAGRK